MHFRVRAYNVYMSRCINL